MSGCDPSFGEWPLKEGATELIGLLLVVLESNLTLE